MNLKSGIKTCGEKQVNSEPLRDFIFIEAYCGEFINDESSLSNVGVGKEDE